MLARSISGAQHGRGVAANSTKKAVAGGDGEGAIRGGEGRVVAAAAADDDLSRCHGVSLTSSWPFSFVSATAGAGYQQVTWLTHTRGSCLLCRAVFVGSCV